MTWSEEGGVICGREGKGEKVRTAEGISLLFGSLPHHLLALFPVSLIDADLVLAP